MGTIGNDVEENGQL